MNTAARESVSRVNEEVAVGEDLRFQRSWWRFERIMWAFLVLVILLDLAGAFGRGPLAHAHVASPDQSIQASFERVARTGTPSIMTVELRGSEPRGANIGLFVSDQIISGLGARRIIPAPASTIIGAGGLTYTFPLGSYPASVRIELQPPGPGVYHFKIAAAGTSVTGSTWVVP